MRKRKFGDRIQIAKKVELDHDFRDLSTKDQLGAFYKLFMSYLNAKKSREWAKYKFKDESLVIYLTELGLEHKTTICWKVDLVKWGGGGGG